jgi:TATA-binding protein-associated factor
MEEKLDKLFSLFNDLKNQQLFILAIQQILTTYREFPSTLYQILKHTNKLIYSKV